MGKSRKKPQVIPVITGIHQQGKPKGKIIALHCHPKAITNALDELVKEAEDNPMLKGLFEDIRVLCAWALARLPMVAPPKEEAKEEDKKEPSTSEEPKAESE